jgi:hypothetical protein
MPLVSVVVPVYISQPQATEIKSFEQCINVLHKHPIVLVCPDSLNIAVYQSIALNFQKQISVERFEDHFFTDTKSYNKLLLSRKFYNRLVDSEFILIYQLDAWVFRDELEYWCAQNYDFVGAPWFTNYAGATAGSSITGIGNGGFSLRKVNTAIRILSSFKRIEPIKNVWKSRNYKQRSFSEKIFFYKYFTLALLFLKNNTFHLFNDFDWNEDYFWSSKAASLFKWYNLPSSEKAMYFSFEVKPELLYSLTDGKLPMGCHAYEKYNPEFWQRFIII